MIRAGCRHPLQEQDIPSLPAMLQPSRLLTEVTRIDGAGMGRFVTCLFALARRPILGMIFWSTLTLGLRLATPFLMVTCLALVGEASQGQAELARAALGVAILALVGCAQLVTEQHHFFHALRSVQVLVTTLNIRLFQKTLRLDRLEHQRYETGDAVNLIGTDADSVAELPWMLTELSFGIITSVGCLLFLFHSLGLAGGLTGLALMALLVPASTHLGARMTTLDRQYMAARDERVSFVAQVIQGIRIVKSFVWEHSVSQEVESFRRRELNNRLESIGVRAFAVAVFSGTTPLVSVVALWVAALTHGTPDLATLFASLTAFSILEGPLGHLSHHVSHIVAAQVSAQRLVAYLAGAESSTAASDAPDTGRPGNPTDPAGSICLRDVRFQFPDAAAPTLDGLTLSVRPGELVAIVGSVGAGKSTLLDLLAGELAPTSGSLTRTGSVGYCPQSPFVLSGTLLDNLVRVVADTSLRTDDSDATLSKALSQVLQATTLDRDLAHWAGGLNAEVGEQGVALSGGQKQRISLARAAMTPRSIMLLDDVFSAVDPSTESHIFQQLLAGLWKDRTRIVVTHRLAWLQHYDRIILLDNGRIAANGSYEELERGSEAFRRFMQDVRAGVAHVEARSQDSQISKPRSTDASHETAPRVTEDEDREVGAVSRQTYRTYFRALCGQGSGQQLRVATVLILSTLISVTIPYSLTAWYGAWGEGRTAMAGLGTHATLAVALFLGLATIMGFVLQYVVWARQALTASRTLHDSAFRQLLHAPMRFFDATPQGRILNRFAKDVDSVERDIAWAFQEAVRAFAATLAGLAIMLSAAPLAVVITTPAAWIYYRMQKSYRAAGRDTKRLFSITRSPRFANFREVFLGLKAIRTNSLGPFFAQRFMDTLHTNQRMYYAMILVNRWFSTRVALVSLLVGGSVSLLIVWAAGGQTLSAGFAAFILTCTLNFFGHLNWSVRSFSEAESRMTAVERLAHYATLTIEDSVVGGSTPALGPAPTSGSIRFEDVSARYADHLPEVLIHASFDIPARSRVAIVGRTGAGKSTLFHLLFRFIQPSSGRILIDHVDISSIPLDRLRRSLAIIPQDPILFLGTLRQNLDRDHQYQDHDLWRVLADVQLSQKVRSLPFQLDAHVSENGSNFSQGERQLLCLARALLLESSIVLLDEATASVDPDTDRRIQRALRQSCHDKTILIIAHRLETVTDADMVLEVQQGRVVVKTNVSAHSSEIRSAHLGETLELEVSRPPC